MNVLSLFDGLSGGQIALERAGIEVDNYYAAEVDKYAITVTQANYPDTVQLGDVTKVTAETIPEPIDLLIGGSPCFTGDTTVVTSRGLVDIRDVLVGDIVLSHTNSWKKVVKIGGKTSETVRVCAQGMLPTDTTYSHPYYVSEMTRVWNNERRTYVRTFAEPTWKDAGTLTKGDFLAVPVISDSIDDMHLTDDECFVIGRYIADGHTSHTMRTSEGRPNDRQWQLILSVGSHKIPHVDSLHYTSFQHTQNTHRVVFSNKRLVEIVEEHCGSGAVNKVISPTLLSLPVDKLKIVIDGIMSGDGSKRGDELRLTTVSKQLAQSLCLAVTKVYNVATSIGYTVRPRTTVIEGRTVNQRDTYTVTYRETVKKQSNFLVGRDHVWVPVKSVTPTGYSERVYNIEVEDDNSYVANNVVVHNCQGFSRAGLGLNFEDPRSKLFFEYVRLLKELKPKYFLLENVKMKKEYMDVISECVGVEPIQIDSALVSAQRRTRLYWTNIPGITQPEDKGIKLESILESGNVDRDKSYCIDACYFKGTDARTYIEKCKRQVVWVIPEATKKGHITVRNGDCVDLTFIKSKTRRGRLMLEKSNCLTAATSMYCKVTNDWFRKLTPLECERLQTVPTWKIETDVVICLDQAKNYVNVVERSPKLRRLVSSAGRNELLEFAKHVGMNTKLNHQSMRCTAQANVDMLTQKLMYACTEDKSVVRSITADIVESKSMCLHQKHVVDSVQPDVRMLTMSEKMELTGKVESRQTDNLCTKVMNGGNVLKLCGNEMMQLVSFVENDSNMDEMSHTTYTTLSRLGLANAEQMLTILYWYAKAVTCGYIVTETSAVSLSVIAEVGYTDHVSNTRRYQMLGNGFTVSVISHILKEIKEDE